MERRGKSNQQHNNITSESTSAGIVIGEGESNRPQPSNNQEADRHLPATNIIRIMRGVLPPHANISDNAAVAVQECVTRFIGHITKEANKRSNSDYRKTVNPEDLMAAMGSLGFADYIGPLKIYLNKYRAQESGPMDRLPATVRRRRAEAQLLPSPTRVARLSPAPLPPPPPPPPADDSQALDPDEYIGLPEIIREYFLGNKSGGGGGGGSQF
ncbi:hypothetical protein ABFX02_14G072100 [Erythranthe guttata]